ncbi:MAG: diphthine synthase [Desulfurococcales archaeon]|nr:diphthine synthase [Desulfurococcales archaeon]
MTLVLAGAGLHPGNVTSEVAELVRGASRVYVDTYTMPGSSWLLEWARSVGGSKVVEATRDVLEAGSSRIVEEARGSLVVVLVPGDPLVATTHISLIVEAAERGVPWRVAPGISGVVSSKTITGLQYYRFGRTITIPGPWRGVTAVSIVSQLYGNLCVGLHTLALLDVSEGGRQLKPDEGARQLLALEDRLAGDMAFDPVLRGLLAVAVERAGSERPRVVWGPLHSIAEGLGAPWGEPSSIVVPGLIHPTEADVVSRLYSLDREVLEAHNRAVRASRLRTCRIYEALSL